MQQALAKDNLLGRIEDASRAGNSQASRFSAQVKCLHYCFKFTSRQAGCPPVIVQSNFMFPLLDTHEHGRIYAAYQRLALRLRCGSATSECTLPQTDENRPGETLEPLVLPPSPDHSFTYAITDTECVAASSSVADCEIYCTFPTTVEPVDVCAMTAQLSRTLRNDMDSFVLTSVPLW